jgi:hypothetical protein
MADTNFTHKNKKINIIFNYYMRYLQDKIEKIKEL